MLHGHVHFSAEAQPSHSMLGCLLPTHQFWADQLGYSPCLHKDSVYASMSKEETYLLTDLSS